MKAFEADLHLHTVLSPCGDVSMSPGGIVAACVEKGIAILGITDHNTTRQCRIVSELGREKGLFVLPGVELTTLEEVHLLAYFPSLGVADLFQGWLDEHLQVVENNPDFFGHQVVVDRDEQVVYEEDHLLIAALDVGIHDAIEVVRRYGGLLIPAHVGKGKNSLFSQLGFIPEGLDVDALEVAVVENRARMMKRYPRATACTFVCGSDAHYVEDIASRKTTLMMEKADFQEIRMALAGESGRWVEL